MICQACSTYEWTGASLINCPNCEAIIGETPELPASAQTQTQTAAEALQETPKMNFFEVKDSITANAVIHVVKAQSVDDAQGVVRKLYRQKGLKYNQSIEVSSMSEEAISKISGYYVWEGSKDSKRVAQRTRLPTGEFV